MTGARVRCHDGAHVPACAGGPLAIAPPPMAGPVVSGGARSLTRDVYILRLHSPRRCRYDCPLITSPRFRYACDASSISDAVSIETDAPIVELSVATLMY